jgi:hypothetical protein
MDKFGRPWRVNHRGSVVNTNAQTVFTLQRNDLELKRLIVSAVNEQFEREQKEKE